MTHNHPKALTDSWGRKIDYLRIAVTDRCNLRCFYCMPAEGINYLPKSELLTFEEIIRLTTIFASIGVNKVRLTGGEPFLRKGFVGLLESISSINGIDQISITTNGVLTQPHLPDLVRLGISSVNLSLDCLDKASFLKITRRDEFDTVMKTLDGLLAHNIKTKINMVVMANKNTDQILPMALLAKSKNIDVRFIEEMPFNGSSVSPEKHWNHTRILNTLKTEFSDIRPIKSDPSNPASLYASDQLTGKLGIIPAYTRSFCDACNRIRLTATGSIKNCLYDEGVLNIRDIMRGEYSDKEISSILSNTVSKKEKDGFAAEKNRTADKDITESMSAIGG